MTDSTRFPYTVALCFSHCIVRFEGHLPRSGVLRCENIPYNMHYTTCSTNDKFAQRVCNVIMHKNKIKNMYNKSKNISQSNDYAGATGTALGISDVTNIDATRQSLECKNPCQKSVIPRSTLLQVHGPRGLRGQRRGQRRGQEEQHSICELRNVVRVYLCSSWGCRSPRPE